MGVQGAVGDVEEGACSCPQGAAFYQEFVLPFEHVEGLVLVVLEMGWRPCPGLRYDLKERVRPAGPLAWDLVGYKLTQHPQRSSALTMTDTMASLPRWTTPARPAA